MEKLLEGFLNLNKIWFGLIFVGSVLNAITKEITFFIGVPYLTLACFFIGFIVGLLAHIRGKWLWV
jgi:hypothetical protein